MEIHDNHSVDTESSAETSQSAIEKELAGKFFTARLRESLFSVLDKSFDSDDFFQDLTQVIMETLECDACSLWRINTPTAEDSKNRIPFVSLIARTLRTDLKDHDDQDAVIHLQSKDSYVHNFSPSFTEEVHEKFKVNRNYLYYLCHGNDLRKSGHRCKNFIDHCGLNYVVGIPIRKKENSEMISLLKLYFKTKPGNGLLDEENGLLGLFSKIIGDFISYCYRQVLSEKRHALLEELMQVYRTDHKKSLKEIFDTFIKKNGGVFQKYFKFEGASFFAWDDLNNYFRLRTTTGLKWQDGRSVDESEYPNVFYTKEDGFTGQCANTTLNPGAQILIYDDYQLAIKQQKMQRTRPFEVENGKNMMLVPISSPTNLDEVIGVLRFVDKKHPQKLSIVDYFNNADKELFQNVGQYLALVIQGFLDKDKQVRQFARMTHEAYAPAQAIFSDIKRIIRFQDRIIGFKEDEDFSRERLFTYFRAIESGATLLKYQSESNLLYAKIDGELPFKEKYPDSDKKISIRQLLNNSKTMVIPLARAAGVSFDNIRIFFSGLTDAQLFIDEKAFQIVIYNLLTNAVKYRKRENKDDFGVHIFVLANRDHYAIIVADNGVGIAEDQKENIFFAGNRGGNERVNIQGFGLGLHISRAIVEDFGGKIFVSQTNNPTAITIELPYDLSLYPRK